MSIFKPKIDNKNLFFYPYLQAATADELLISLKESRDNTKSLLKGITAEQANYKYSPEKWTVKQVLHHITDCERILSYRFLRLNRGDATELLAFDRELLVENEQISLSVEALLEEFFAVRNASIQLIKTSNTSLLDFKAPYKDIELSPRILGWMIAGHNQHHLNLLKEKYKL
ncbi:DinB family protein [Mesonia aquimarina]|uniref:DinB family protein n=1 Tax=Mesonia aquimarina TaxID=1504967 RepID=UPI000EF56C6D|nr:DinB family protein [Mesonia aquimarina]